MNTSSQGLRQALLRYAQHLAGELDGQDEIKTPAELRQPSFTTANYDSQAHRR